MVRNVTAGTGEGGRIVGLCGFSFGGKTKAQELVRKIELYLTGVCGRALGKSDWLKVTFLHLSFYSESLWVHACG